MAKKKTTKKTKKKVSKKASKKMTKKATKKKIASKKKASKKKTSKKAVAKKVTKKKVESKKKAEKKTATQKTASESPANSRMNKVESNSSPLKAKMKRKRGMSVSEIARITEADSKGFVIINGRKVRVISTPDGIKKKKRTKKIKKTDAVSTIKRTTKTTLSAKELRGYRDRLMKYRAQLLVDLGAIENEALTSNSDISHMPIHMADVGSDAYDQDLKLGMAASERKRILDIEDALIRIRKKTYGVCQLTGSPIPSTRLRAKPWAKYTKEAAEKVERQNRRAC
ncbi:TraR/DksA family transcriptional regulator [PVC group bacterium]|nr:TraR/DksA family transcriptional regulator [PVC group bacterium]